jgi:hypothetical protein
MSDRPPKPETNDPLLAALRHLPSHASEGPVDARLHREARAAYARSFEKSSWSSALDKVGRAAMPVFLAGIVGLYMTWAIASATALVR